MDSSGQQKTGSTWIPQEAKDAFGHAINKVKEYFVAEFMAGSGDYQLLQILNNLARARLSEISKQAQILIQQASALTQQQSQIQPFLDRLDEIEARVRYLEQLATELEQYVKLVEK